MNRSVKAMLDKIMGEPLQNITASVLASTGGAVASGNRVAQYSNMEAAWLGGTYTYEEGAEGKVGRGLRPLIDEWIDKYGVVTGTDASSGTRPSQLVSLGDSMKLSGSRILPTSTTVAIRPGAGLSTDQGFLSFKEGTPNFRQFQIDQGLDPSQVGARGGPSQEYWRRLQDSSGYKEMEEHLRHNRMKEAQAAITYGEKQTALEMNLQGQKPVINLGAWVYAKSGAGETKEAAQLDTMMHTATFGMMGADRSGEKGLPSILNMVKEERKEIEGLATIANFVHQTTWGIAGSAESPKEVLAKFDAEKIPELLATSTTGEQFKARISDTDALGGKKKKSGGSGTVSRSIGWGAQEDAMSSINKSLRHTQRMLADLDKRISKIPVATSGKVN